MARAPEEPFTTEALILRAPLAHELRVRVVASAVCHTDVMTKNEGLCSFPIVLGHEGVGIVDALGADVSGFDVGDHVILSYDYCGQCLQCKRHKPSYCDSHGRLNFAGKRPDGSLTHRVPGSDAPDVFGSFFQQSSFATHALTHESNTIKVDRSLPLASLAPLGCGVQTGAGTVFNTLQVEGGTSVVVFGAGCVGLSAIMAAKVAGAMNIIAVDLNEARLKTATSLGASHTCTPHAFDAPTDLVEHIKSVTGTNGCQYAVDTTGIPDVLRQAFDCCGPLGVTAMIAPGVPGTEVTLEMLGLLPGKSLRGVVQGDSESKTFIPRLIDLWKRGLFPFDEMITRFESIDSLDGAVRAMSSGEVIKPVIVMDPAF